MLYSQSLAGSRRPLLLYHEHFFHRHFTDRLRFRRCAPVRQRQNTGESMYKFILWRNSATLTQHFFELHRLGTANATQTA
jgi:hypothetical protein